MQHTHVNSKLGDFNIEHWPIHSEKKQRKNATRVTEHRARGRDTYGIQVNLILNFPLKSTIPCNMHCIMAILHKLVPLLDLVPHKKQKQLDLALVT
jgi:hypothetical protein